MRGHLQRRGRESWRLKVYAGRRDGGRKRYVERTVRGARRDAERALARLVVEVDDGRHPETRPVRFAQLVEEWLAMKALSAEASTWTSYEWAARTYLLPALGDRPIVGIRALDLDRLYRSLHDRGLGTRTVRLCHTVVRQSLEQARHWDLLAANPALDATPPTAPRRPVTPPTVEQVCALIDRATAEDPDFGTYLWLLATTGCRRSEACALRWREVHLDAGQLTISRAIGMAHGVPYEKDTKTHQARRVAIDRQTVAVLHVHHQRMRERVQTLGGTLTSDAHVFARGSGTRWRPDVCTNRFARLRDRLGLVGVRLHDLRHFAATALGDAGTPIAAISYRLGHRDTATTLGMYVHTLPATDQVAAAALGTLLTPAARTLLEHPPSKEPETP